MHPLNANSTQCSLHSRFQCCECNEFVAEKQNTSLLLRYIDLTIAGALYRMLMLVLTIQSSCYLPASEVN